MTTLVVGVFLLVAFVRDARVVQSAHPVSGAERAADAPAVLSQVARATTTTSAASPTGLGAELQVRPRGQLPTTIPNDPKVHEKLIADFGPEAYVERATFKLATNEYLDRCAGGRVPRGKLYFWVIWDVDAEGGRLANPTVEEIVNEPQAPSEGFDANDRALIVKCASDFAASISSWDLPAVAEMKNIPEVRWLMKAQFPVNEARIYSLLRP